MGSARIRGIVYVTISKIRVFTRTCFPW